MSVISGTSSRSEVAKLSVLFEKINSSQNIEIEERSIKNIAQKVQLNLVTASDLAANHAHQVGYILNWLRSKKQHATSSSLVNCLSILGHVANCERGRQVLQELQAAALLHDMFKSSEDETIKDSIQQIMSGILDEKPQFNTIGDVDASASKQSFLSDEDLNMSNRQRPHQSIHQNAFGSKMSTKTDFVVKAVESNQQSAQKSVPIQTGQNPVHTSHMEILHKNLCLKEPCELPFISLDDQDEKRLFDISVQLKFGDFRTVLLACQQLESILQDFPVEVLLQRTDIIKALLDLLEGGTASQGAFTNLAQQQLMILSRRLRQLYKFNTNTTTKKSPGSSHQTHEYINISYPPCKDQLWNTVEATQDIKKYGAQLPSEKLAAATLQGSLSCRAVLGLIITKSTYLLKDTEKIGLYIQLIKEAWRSVQEIYRVEDNFEFTELLHLILFAFDQVCDFYRDQIFEEVLITPVLNEALEFVSTLNSIVSECKERFKLPFTETLFKNTEKLQMTLRRALFTLDQPEANKKIILNFFDRIEKDLPQINLLQKQVPASFNRANEALRRFNKVHGFKLSGTTNFEDINFVDSLAQLTSGIDILEELTGCIELKIEFPFEHLLLDCMVFSQLLVDQNQQGKIEDVERLVVTYLSIPISQVRERLVRRLFQRVRVVQAFQQQTKYKVNNNYLLAKFCYRKRILNQFINGMLINFEIASEETKLQLDLGTVLIKVLIIAYNEAGLQAHKSANLNSFLLTFQSILHRYPDLIGLIDLIEENAQQNCRYLRTLRDLFSRQPHKREFSTSVVRNSQAKDSAQSQDLLLTVTDLKQETGEMEAELDLVNLNYDFAAFDLVNITGILMSAKSDFNLRKSSLEQLTMLLFDTQKKGKSLFLNQGVTDVFTFVVQEILTAYKTSKTYLADLVNELPNDQLQYLDWCFKFTALSQIFYTDEAPVKDLFDKIRVFTAQKVDFQQCERFENLINACVYFSGSQLRKNAVRVLYLMVFSPVILRTKISIGSGKRKVVQVMIPDFCSKAFIMLIPFQGQVVRQPLRDDLILSDEQKDFVRAMIAAPDRASHQDDLLNQVAHRFVSSTPEDYHQIMQSYEQLQNFILALSSASENLISVSVLQRLQDVFRMLPTKDFEFNFLADFCMFTNQILTVADNLTNTKQVEALIQTLCQALRFHMLPYLFEASLQGIEHELQNVHSSKLLFLIQFFELLLKVAQVDTTFRQKYRMPSRFQENVLSTQLIDYLTSLYIILKDRQEHRHKILFLLNFITTQYDTKNLKLDKLPQLLIGTIAQHRLSHSFESNSMIMTSVRTLIFIYHKRLTHVAVNAAKGDLDHSVGLSQTATKALQDFQSTGWLTRFTESRDARLRCMAWDLLTEMLDYTFFKQNQSLVHQALSSIMREGELYCAKIAVLKFVNKVCQCLIHNVDSQSALNRDLERSVGGDDSYISVYEILDQINKQGIISKIHHVLVQRDCPLQIISLLLQLVSNMIQIDFKRSLPILTQLDYWTVLVDLISIENLRRQEIMENRQAIIQVQATLLYSVEPKLDLVYLTLNTVIEFIFQAMKQDSQLANLLVKTTKLIPTLFAVMKQTLDSNSELNNPQMAQLQNNGLILIFIDKVVKVLHVALMHPRDHSLTLLHNFFDRQLSIEEQDETYGWVYLIKMLKLVGSKHSLYFYGHIDVKLAICRFVAEYLLRVSQAGLKHHLDVTLHPFDATLHINTDTLQEQDLSTYGGTLLLEFGKVFRALYVDTRDTREQISVPNKESEHENSKIDICVSLAVLCGASESAKVQSVEQNLLKKILEICCENVQALNLIELQRLANKNKQQPTPSMTKATTDSTRKFKYAQINDGEGCEREINRMFSLIRHVLYKSGGLLQDLLLPSAQQPEDLQQKSFVSQNAISKSTALKVQRNKEVSLCDRLTDLFGLTIEQINCSGVLEQCYQTAITMASQNKRFKNAFLTACPSLAGSKRNTVVKAAVNQILKEPLQANNKLMHLSFALLRSASLSQEVVKEVSKLRLIEDVQSQLENACKSEKDIKLLKSFLCHYTAFLAGYAFTEEGQKTVMKLKQVFTMSLFVIDTVTPPQGPEVTPITQLVLNVLLFLRNSSINRVGKQHFISDPAFLPCLMAFLSSRQQHPRVRAQTAACLWQTLFNHQGVKAALNSESVRTELQMLQSEYQRVTDISTYASFVTSHAERGQDPLAFDIVDHKDDREMETIRKMEHFTLVALNGILTLIEA